MSADAIPEARSPEALNAEKVFLVDPYLDWAKEQRIPIHEDFGIDLLAIETAPWDWYGARGAFAHTHGRGDFMANYVVEIPPGGKSAPVRHLYENFVYVLSGRGSTTLWLPNGEKQTFEWGPTSLFAIPLNARYQVFNGSGQETVRLSCTNDAPLTLNVYHDRDFVFNNPYQFGSRFGKPNEYEGEGRHVPVDRGEAVSALNIWETSFIPSLKDFKLYAYNARGKGTTNCSFVLADGVQHSHCSEMPTGRYKKAHRHNAGTHVHAVTGIGYSLLWYEGDDKFVEIPWRHGVMYAPPHWMYHQHFNTGPERARYLACGLGSRRYPLSSLRKKSGAGAGQLSVKKGGRQIEFEDQDPRIHRKWLEEIARQGVKSEMGDVFDEPGIMKLDMKEYTGVIKTPVSTGPSE
jgi:mannose-6-phosphate isomerase-like protein (cupin superfamily)